MLQMPELWRPVRLRSHSIAALSGIAFAALLSLGLPAQATSQISSKVVSAPKIGNETAHVTQAKLPKAPVQVEMPPPPPIKYFPGLEEPLVATGPVTDAEGNDLDAALKQFHDLPLQLKGPNIDYSDYAKPLLGFIDTHRGSNWNSALLLNIGLGYYHAGYYSKAFTSFEQSWQAGRNATSPQARLMVDRAVGELARMHARVGHKKELEAVLADIGNRPIGGPATELIQGAREGLDDFKHHPEIAYLCGPQALKNLLVALKAKPKEIEITDKARSGPHGFNLAELAALADKTKLKYKLIFRKPGQPVPVPSIANWNIHHYAAIVSVTEGHYLVQDATFAQEEGGDLTEKAIDAESSGYFLVPAEVVAAHKDAGWRIITANSDEAKAIYGMGKTTDDNDDCFICHSDMLKVGVNILAGAIRSSISPVIPALYGLPMTTASAFTMNVNLHLQDTPVGYNPQIGLPDATTISYNQREAFQPATLSYSNLSPKWSHSWMATFEDTPGALNVSGYRLASLGGGYKNPVGHYNTTTGAFDAEVPDNSVVYRIPPDPHSPATSYEHRLPDGSKEVFGQNNGATSFPRIWFLTSVVDPQGNTTTIHYNSMTCPTCITSISDAMGRSTTFTYGLSSYPLLITKITDPFGRYTQITYDTSQRLSSITDPVGITSSFTYSSSEPTFVTQLTTPYGTSVFSDTTNPNDTPSSGSVWRSLTLKDPLGNTDYYDFFQYNTSPYITNPTESSSVVPTGMLGTDNGLL